MARNDDVSSTPFLSLKPIPMKTGGTRDPHWHSRLLTDYFSLRQHSSSYNRVSVTSAQPTPFDLHSSKSPLSIRERFVRASLLNRPCHRE
ncbi:hypothetical protein WN51_01282 [Melipona quadrifasciata]|uniref:Uncharacterized protein n=1 Tax=Melipona quadrifasciata TaxID=166423 RepID=A0A0M8ZX53_9HYME|nr:hypothetical protein WN51_01282 [Melipona quadrifasciata]